MKIILAQPRGFCAGVDRAIDIVEEALKIYGRPVYVRHEIVHNKRVVEDLKEKGAIFVEEISEIPNGAVTVFSAHGVSRKVEDDAKLRKLQPQIKMHHKLSIYNSDLSAQTSLETSYAMQIFQMFKCSHLIIAVAAHSLRCVICIWITKESFQT